jgi:hypothetical protein
MKGYTQLTSKRGDAIMSLLLAGYYKTIFTRLVLDNSIPYTFNAPFGQDVFPCQERQAPNGASLFKPEQAKGLVSGR